MINGHFYFIRDEFYNSLPDCGLMTNKENDVSGVHGRPCHYCFDNGDFLWMIPISSKIKKYKSIYEKKVSQRGSCDTIRFGFVNGEERAFLIQNAFPVTKAYVGDEYKVEHNSVPVVVNESLSKELNGLIRKVIRLYARGINMPFTDLDRIIRFLNNQKPKEVDEKSEVF